MRKAWIVRKDGKLLGQWRFTGVRINEPEFTDKIAIIYDLPKDEKMIAEAVARCKELGHEVEVTYVHM